LFLYAFVVQNGGRWRCHFFAKVAFSGFLLGNREKIAFATTSGFSFFPAKMPAV